MDDQSLPRSTMTLASLAPLEGEKKYRLTVGVYSRSKTIRIWDKTGFFVELSFDDAPFLISQITNGLKTTNP